MSHPIRCTHCRSSSDFGSQVLGGVHFPPANVHLPPPMMGVNQLGELAPQALSTAEAPAYTPVHTRAPLVVT